MHASAADTSDAAPSGGGARRALRDPRRPRSGAGAAPGRSRSPAPDGATSIGVRPRTRRRASGRGGGRCGARSRHGRACRPATSRAMRLSAAVRRRWSERRSAPRRRASGAGGWHGGRGRYRVAMFRPTAAKTVQVSRFGAPPGRVGAPGAPAQQTQTKGAALAADIAGQRRRVEPSPAGRIERQERAPAAVRRGFPGAAARGPRRARPAVRNRR